MIYIESQLRTQRKRFESILHQKSRELWIAKRDRNTNYFHTSVLTRRRTNIILAIEDNGRWLNSLGDVGNYFILEFQELYTKSSPDIPWLGVIGGMEISEGDNS